jgi:hypothetical protein
MTSFWYLDITPKSAWPHCGQTVGGATALDLAVDPDGLRLRPFPAASDLLHGRGGSAQDLVPLVVEVRALVDLSEFGQGEGLRAELTAGLPRDGLDTSHRWPVTAALLPLVTAESPKHLRDPFKCIAILLIVGQQQLLEAVVAADLPAVPPGDCLKPRGFLGRPAEAQAASHALEFVGADREVDAGVDQRQHIDATRLDPGEQTGVAAVASRHLLEELAFVAAVMQQHEVPQRQHRRQEGRPDARLICLTVRPEVQTSSGFALHDG